MIILPWVIEAIVRQALLKGATTMGTNRNEYIHNVASTVLGQMGGVSYAGDNNMLGWREPDDDNYPQTFWDQHGGKVMGMVERMGPSARGRILACGVANLGKNGMLPYHKVNGGLCITEVDGDELLSLLASYVVAAAIIDIIRDGIREVREEATQKLEMQGEHAFDHIT
jgi:hypothetical protein